MLVGIVPWRDVDSIYRLDRLDIEPMVERMKPTISTHITICIRTHRFSCICMYIYICNMRI
jgi:hypothetical protein